MYSIFDIGLYQELSQREDSNAKLYTGLLIPIVSDMGAFLELVKKEFPTYPDHSIQHSFRLLKYLSAFIDESTKEKMSDTEIFCVIMAALFHDTGMALYNNNNKSGIRSKHNEFSSLVLDKYFKEKLTIIQQRDRLKSIIEFACYAHGISIQELYNDTRFSRKDKINFDVVRSSLIAILLRIGDLMDLEEERTSEFILSYFKNAYDMTSLNHNLRHTKLQTYDYSPSALYVEVEVDNILQYKIWSEWFEYMKQDILHANSYFDCDIKKFPFPKTQINKSSEANFAVEELRFEIDESGNIWNVISQSIYTDGFDFLREAIKNSIDAELVNIYKKTDLPLDNASPRSWNVSKYCSNIIVAYSEQRNLLLIIDSGIGMNYNDLEKFLFKVTGTGYSKLDNREFAFPSIAKFGIGFVSCLINSQKIEIFTKKSEDEKAYHVTMENGSNLSFIQEMNVQNFVGTTLRLELKHNFNYEEVNAYVKETFLFPSVGIDCIDIDNLERIYKHIFSLDDFEVFLSFCRICEFKPQYDNIKGIAKKEYALLAPNVDYWHDINKKTVILLEWFKEETGSTGLSDKDIFKSFKVKINDLIKSINPDEHLIFPLMPSDIKEKSISKNPREYIDILENFSVLLEKEHEKYKKQQELYKLKNIQINVFPVSANFKWKYCVIFVDSYLRIYDVKYALAPIKLKKGTGIIFINHENCDFNSGIEFSSLNGFIFANGRICSTIAKFSRRGSSYSQSIKSFTIG